MIFATSLFALALLSVGQDAPQANMAVTPPKVDLPPTFLTDDDYPKDALQRRQQGTTKVVLRISAKGKAIGCRVTESSGAQSLDDATCAFISRWKFKPGRDAEGHAVEADFKSSMTWKLPAR